MDEELERWYFLTEKSLENNLSQEEAAELAALMESEEEFKELFLQIRHQHAHLTLDPRVSGPISSAWSNEFASKIIKEQPLENTKAALWKWSLVAAIFALTFSLWLFMVDDVNRSEQTIAVIENTDSCIWRSGSLPTLKGSQLKAGVLSLESGYVSLRFHSGALIKLEGPAELKIEAPLLCHLVSGTMVAEVPPSAHLFKVITPKAEIVDLGTSFALKVNKHGESQFRVLNGEIEARALGSEQSHRLALGQAGRVLNDGVYAPLINVQDEINFLYKEVAHEHHTLKIRTDQGQGDDAYVASQIHENVSDSLLLVKNGAGAKSNFQRQAYLRFDLNTIPEGLLKKATLQLQFLPTGFGIGMDLPDSEFEVYAVNDDELDNWEYKKINWENAPFNVDSQFDLSKVKKVGSFIVERGVDSKLVEVTSATLKELITTDHNGLLTLIVVRTTIGNYYQKNDTLVHGIASRRHPKAQPPTLKLDIAPINNI